MGIIFNHKCYVYKLLLESKLENTKNSTTIYTAKQVRYYGHANKTRKILFNFAFSLHLFSLDLFSQQKFLFINFLKKNFGL